MEDDEVERIGGFGGESTPLRSDATASWKDDPAGVRRSLRRYENPPRKRPGTSCPQLIISWPFGLLVEAGQARPWGGAKEITQVRVNRF